MIIRSISTGGYRNYFSRWQSISSRQFQNRRTTRRNEGWEEGLTNVRERARRVANALAEKRFPSTVRKSNITRRRALRVPFPVRWSFFNPAIDVKLFKSRFPLNCRGFRFHRSGRPNFRDRSFDLCTISLSLSLFLSLSWNLLAYHPEIRLYFRQILSSVEGGAHDLIEASIRLHSPPLVRYFPRSNSSRRLEGGRGHVCGKQIRNYGNLINSKFAASRSPTPA